MSDYNLRIKLLTPLWTGDANGKSTLLRETGLIGSLRWWYESIVHGLGGTSCNPTIKSRGNKCTGTNHCDVCELFGCEGWSRKFRLEVTANDLRSVGVLWIGTREGRGRNNNKFLKRGVNGLISSQSITLSFIPLRDFSPQVCYLLYKTLKVIADYGSLGGRSSQGNGIIKVVDDSNFPHKEHPSNFDFKKTGVNNSPLNLEQFFFLKFHITFNEDISSLIDREVFWTHDNKHTSFDPKWNIWKDFWDNYNFLPIGFHVRDSLRHLVNDRGKRHKIFGELGTGSKIFVSHGYKQSDSSIEVRIWCQGHGSDNSIANDISSLKDDIKNQIMIRLKDKLFSSNGSPDLLTECNLTEEKTGKDILGAL